MNNRRLKISGEISTLLRGSSKICEFVGLNFASEVVVLGQLAMMKDSTFHRYLLKKGIKYEEIIAKSNEFFGEYLKTAAKNCKSCVKVNVLYVNREKPEDVLISMETYKILEIAGEIAFNYYNTDMITNEHILAAFAEYKPDLFFEFVSMLLGADVFSPKGFYDAEEFYLPTDQDFPIPSSLASFLTVMNDKYSPTEERCDILGRDEETNQLIKILAKATKRNAILVGYPGVGKTAIVEKFTWSIVTGNCHQMFKNAKILALDVTSIVAGTKYRGSAEARFQDLVAFLEANPGCILFIDEIHTILGAGACKDGEIDLANSLKPILARGDTQVIGATTFDEYEKYFSKDAALKRRFEKIVVNEPHIDELYDMIQNQIFRLENYHNTTISKELVDFAVLNASCFNFETKNPDRTLDLIDRSMAGAELKGKSFVEKEDILENFAIRRKQFEMMSEAKKKATAYHEAGHYIVQKFSPEIEQYKTLAVSIMPAEDYLGINVFEVDENATPSTDRDAYIQLIARALGGRIAEKMFTSKLSSGASSDLMKATRIAKDMITRYGLDEDFTENRVYLRESQNPMYTESLIEKINTEIDKIIDEAKIYATELLRDHKTELLILVDALMEKGILSKADLDTIFK